MEFFKASGPLNSSALDASSEMSALAFKDGSAFIEVFRDPAKRQQEIQYIFSKNMALVQNKAPQAVYCYYTDSSCKEMACVFQLIHSSVQFTFWDKVWAGLLAVFFAYDSNTFTRMMESAEFFENMDAELFGSRPHLHLDRLVVNPALQGKGIGSKLLGEALKDADKQGLPVSLATQAEKNVVFYQRL